MDFRHSNNASIRERHRCVSIFVEQFAQVPEMLVDTKRKTQSPILDKLQQGILSFRVTGEQIHRFSEDRLTNEQGSVELLETLRDPIVKLLGAVKKSDQRSCINDGYGHRGRSL